jgi:hypothetical protein
MAVFTRSLLIGMQEGGTVPTDVRNPISSDVLLCGVDPKHLGCARGGTDRIAESSDEGDAMGHIRKVFLSPARILRRDPSLRYFLRLASELTAISKVSRRGH